MDIIRGNNIVIDLETMAVSSNAAIMAIGAVKFDNASVNDIFYRVVSLESCLNVGLVVDASTINWWLKQSNEARKELLSDPKPLKDVLVDFAAWAGENPVIWGNGAAFDNVILANAYTAVGLPVPWGYKNDRCYRTVKSLFPDIKPVKMSGVKHKAVDDAFNEATHLMKILELFDEQFED